MIKWLSWKDAEEWGAIACPFFDGKKIMTYFPKGCPVFNTYTAPFVDEDGDICYYKYDHDEDCWDDVIHCLGTI